VQSHLLKTLKTAFPMAKKKFESSFAAFREQLKKEKIKEVQIAVKEERRYFLIVSEGIRTEPIYFKYLSGLLPKNLVDTIEVDGAGDNTINVVRKAMLLREDRSNNKNLPQYDEVWAVYDKDDFPPTRYNEAIDLAAREGIQSGHSNQSFELWYILHYEFLQSALHRTDYIRKMKGHLGFKYTKNTPKVVEKIMETGNVQQAIIWAKELEKLHDGKTAADSCPHTKVYILVEKILAYIENNKPKPVGPKTKE